MGLLGEYRERVGGLHPALRRVPEDPTSPPAKETKARAAPLQEVGCGGASVDLGGGRRCVHGEQHVPRLHAKEGGRGVTPFCVFKSMV